MARCRSANARHRPRAVIATPEIFEKSIHAATKVSNMGLCCLQRRSGASDAGAKVPREGQGYVVQDGEGGRDFPSQMRAGHPKGEVRMSA